MLDKDPNGLHLNFTSIAFPSLPTSTTWKFLQNSVSSQVFQVLVTRQWSWYPWPISMFCLISEGKKSCGRASLKSRGFYDISSRTYSTEWLLCSKSVPSVLWLTDRDENYYRPHPKDGEGNVFSLSTTGGGSTPVLAEGTPVPARGHPLQPSRTRVTPGQD